LIDLIVDFLHVLNEPIDFDGRAGSLPLGLHEQLNYMRRLIRRWSNGREIAFARYVLTAATASA
jgi:hypothetical protein